MFQSPGSIALDLGFLTIHWYGILIALGFISGVFVCSYVAKEKGENPDNFIDLATFILISAVIGARFYYVIFNWAEYALDPVSMFKIWEGGLAIHGGIIGGLIAGIVFCSYKKLSFPKYCDITCVGLILGQAIGRWGNFFNSEAFGTPTDLPWKLFIPAANRPVEYINYEYFHPTFLYESLWNIGVFLILFFVLRKPLNTHNGALFLAYLGLYSAGRIVIEQFRTDSLMFLDTIRIAQLVSLLLIIGSIGGLYYLLKIKKVSKSSSPDEQSS